MPDIPKPQPESPRTRAEVPEGTRDAGENKPNLVDIARQETAAPDVAKPVPSNDSAGKHLPKVEIQGTPREPATKTTTPRAQRDEAPAQAGHRDRPKAEPRTSAEQTRTPRADNTPEVTKRTPPNNGNRGDVKPGTGSVQGMFFQAPLRASEIAQVTAPIFDRIDKDHDGFLSKSELSDARQDPHYMGKEDQAISTLHANVEKLQTLHNDEYGWENDGITRGDLQEFSKRAFAHDEATRAMDNAEDWTSVRFHNFDKDQSRGLSMKEIQSGLAKPNLSLDDFRMLSYLKDNFTRVSHAKNDGEWFYNSELSYDDVRAQQRNVNYYPWSGANAAASMNGRAINIDPSLFR